MSKMSLRILICSLLAVALVLLLFFIFRNVVWPSPEVSTSSTTTTEAPLGDATVYSYDNFCVAYNLAYGDRVDLHSKTEIANSQIFDIYLPKMPDQLSEDTKVLLYVHGGAWSNTQCDKTSDGPWYAQNLAQNGMVVFCMNYILQNGTGTKPNATIDDMLADIDAMIFHMSQLLPKLGIKTDSIAIGGTSAGAHLSSLYAYKNYDTSPLKIAFLVDIVAPTNLLTYKPVIEHMLLLTMGNYDLVNNALLEFGGIGLNLFSGLADAPSGKENMDEMWEKLDVYSSIHYVSDNACPTILAYAKTDDLPLPSFLLPNGFECDGLVSTECYYEMIDKLTEFEIPFSAQLFEGVSHDDVWKAPQGDWIVDQILEFAELYL